MVLNLIQFFSEKEVSVYQGWKLAAASITNISNKTKTTK